ncbi:MAG: hypothetical protein LBP59_15700 [Planctomycetaceae bacterium]|jgi:hypothetical protein|nr:hypothetical protein [Planctomycetaceae bacterium]
MRLYSTANERGYISTAFWFAFRQSAGETPAIRWSRLLFRIAGISGSRAFCLCSFRFAGEAPVSQDRGRLACMRLYSTANERSYISTAFLFAFRQIASETPAIRWSRLLFRINILNQNINYNIK